MSQDVILTVMNSMSLNNNSVNMEMLKCELCEKCLNLDAELSKSKQAYNDLLKNYSQLEKHCISLEVSMQLKQEVFQNDDSYVSQNVVEIPEYFEINDLKARLQDKDKTICKLKDTIKSLRENTKEEKVNPDKCDLEPINKELENSVAKLLSENERLCNEINHVKQVFKDQFDSIKQTRVRHKEQSDSLINKLNLKSVENEDLKAQIQDKVFVITSLKNDLRKLKGKKNCQKMLTIPSGTITAPGMFKLDLVPLPPRLLQNRDVHIDYLRHTQEQANTLWELVEQAKAKQPLDRELDFACKYATRIQELLVYVQDTCPIDITPSPKKVVVTPMNISRKVRFAEPLTSSSNIKQVVQIILWYPDFRCSKHITGNRSQLMNFISKFLGTVSIRNGPNCKSMRKQVMSNVLNVVYPGDNNDFPNDKSPYLYNPCNLARSPDTRVQSGKPVMTREEDDGISVALDPQTALIHKFVETINLTHCRDNQKCVRNLNVFEDITLFNDAWDVRMFRKPNFLTIVHGM
ncbi:hypothetical protein Tco_1219571 [Tanacetum coccineum]